MQKRNDYVRYKTLRKINRRRKVDQEKQSKIAEKELTPDSVECYKY